ncbi:Uncharacterised protein [Mycobacterium tuberculosis]|nr:Uncharacterised protein [Mycobacterium tuberculosis]
MIVWREFDWRSGQLGRNRDRIDMNEGGPDFVDLPVFAHRGTQLVLVDFVWLDFQLGGEGALGEDQHVIAGARGRRAVHRAQIAVAAVHRQRMKQGAVDHRGKAAGGAGWISRELRDVGLHEAGRGQTALLSGLGGSRDGGGREVDADHGVAVGGKGQ